MWIWLITWFAFLAKAEHPTMVTGFPTDFVPMQAVDFDSAISNSSSEEGYVPSITKVRGTLPRAKVPMKEDAKKVSYTKDTELSSGARISSSGTQPYDALLKSEIDSSGTVKNLEWKKNDGEKAVLANPHLNGKQLNKKDLEKLAKGEAKLEIADLKFTAPPERVQGCGLNTGPEAAQ